MGGAPLQPALPFWREPARQRVAFDELRLSGNRAKYPIPLGLSLSKPVRNITCQA